MTTTSNPPRTFDLTGPDGFSQMGVPATVARDIAAAAVLSTGATVWITDADDGALTETHYRIDGLSLPAHRRNWTESPGSFRIYVTLPSGTNVDFTVDVRNVRTPTVNWSAVGATTTADAREFAAALAHTANLCDSHAKAARA